MNSDKRYMGLACPMDNLALVREGRSLVCENGHNYDIAKKGYVNLLPVQDKRSKAPGDSKDMVLARKDFLAAGYYTPIAEKLVEILSARSVFSTNTTILDAGCGEGYYLDYLYKTCIHGLKSVEIFKPCRNQPSPCSKHSFVGVDISKDAIAESTKCNQYITWVVGTNRKLPILEKSIDVLICMFGFASPTEFSRVLRPGGLLLSVDPGPRHLIELRQLIYEEMKEPAEKKTQLEGYVLTQNESFVRETIELNNKDVTNLFKMTPHFYRVAKERRALLDRHQSLRLSIDVCFSLYEYLG